MSKVRKNLPPVPKFDEKPKLSVPAENQQETLNKFLMEIKGEEPPNMKDSENILKTNANSPKMTHKPSGVGELKVQGISVKIIEKQSDQMKQIGTALAPQKADFKQSLDLINNIYNKQMKSEGKEVPLKKATIDSSKENKEKPMTLIKLNEEYDPAYPNDYETLANERSEKIKKNKKDKDEKKNKANANLNHHNNNGNSNKMEIENDTKNVYTIPNPPLTNNTKPDKTKLPSPRSKLYTEIFSINHREEKIVEEKERELTSEEKILKMMEKSGWKLGQGLGKNEQGMTTPLIPKKTTSNTAIIVNSSVDMTSLLPQELVLKKSLESQNITITNVIYLANMTTLDLIDDSLREEVSEECSKYGVVNDCVIFAMKNVPEEEAVRIFVEFDKKESAMKAYFSINGRFFAGRIVVVRFYDEKLYKEGHYDQ